MQLIELSRASVHLALMLCVGSLGLGCLTSGESEQGTCSAKLLVKSGAIELLELTYDSPSEGSETVWLEPFSIDGEKLSVPADVSHLRAVGAESRLVYLDRPVRLVCGKTTDLIVKPKDPDRDEPPDWLDASTNDASTNDASTNDASTGPSLDAGELDASTEPGCDTGTRCASACIDLQTSSEHCGICGRSCAGNPCSGGECQPLMLASGLYLPDLIVVSNQFIYFTDGGADKIYRLPVNGSAAPEAFVTGLTVAPKKLELTAGVLFWDQNDVVYATAEQAANPSQVLDGTTCWTSTADALFAVYPSYATWTDCTCEDETTHALTACSEDACASSHCTCSADGRVVKTSRDGSAATTLYTGSIIKTGSPNCIDATSDALLLSHSPALSSGCSSDPHQWSVELVRISLTGAEPKVVGDFHSGRAAVSNFGVFVADNYAYFDAMPILCGDESYTAVEGHRVLVTGGDVADLDYGACAVYSLKGSHYQLHCASGYVQQFDPQQPTSQTVRYWSATQLAASAEYLYVSDKNNGLVLRLLP